MLQKKPADMSEDDYRLELLEEELIRTNSVFRGLRKLQESNRVERGRIRRFSKMIDQFTGGAGGVRQIVKDKVSGKLKYADDDKEWLREHLPLDDSLLRMVIQHIPNPGESQKYKIPSIWQGDLESEIGKSLLACDPDGPLLGMITKIFIDPLQYNLLGFLIQLIACSWICHNPVVNHLTEFR